MRIATKYKYLLLLVVLSDAKIGLTHGKDLALGELGEETIERDGYCNQTRSKSRTIKDIAVEPTTVREESWSSP